MAYVITSLCLRDGACVEVCPVDCIVPGLPEAEWPWYFIDPDTCIDCGSCLPECPYDAIFEDGDVPTAVKLGDDQEVRPFGGTPYKEGGKVIDLTLDIPHNGDYFTKGPGYGALP